MFKVFKRQSKGWEQKAETDDYAEAVRIATELCFAGEVGYTEPSGDLPMGFFSGDKSSHKCKAYIAINDHAHKAFRAIEKA